jgi:hypothetical protein
MVDDPMNCRIRTKMLTTAIVPHAASVQSSRAVPMSVSILWTTRNGIATMAIMTSQMTCDARSKPLTASINSSQESFSSMQRLLPCASTTKKMIRKTFQSPSQLAMVKTMKRHRRPPNCHRIVLSSLLSLSHWLWWQWH